MTAYIIRRILLMFPTLIGMTAVTFFVMALSPGGVGGPQMSQLGAIKSEALRAQQEYYEKRFGLSDPPIEQYVRWLNSVSPIGFETHEDGSRGRWRWLKMPDLGQSFSRGRPVLDLVEESLPVTLLLNAVTIPITTVIGVVAGIYAARRRGGKFDVTSGFAFLALWAIPTIWAGVMLIGYFANRRYFDWFPTDGLHDLLASSMPFFPHFTPTGWERGWLLDTAWHLCLPCLCLSYGAFAFQARLTRGAVLDNLGSDYARTARAKGLDERSTLFRHVFRNSLLPLLTMFAGLLPGLFGGSLIIENIFSLHGMGQLMVEAVNSRDRELILDDTLVIGFLGLVNYLLTDLLYAVADPRVSYE